MNNPLDLSEAAIKKRGAENYLAALDWVSAQVMQRFQQHVDQQVSMAVKSLPLVGENMELLKDRLTVSVGQTTGKITFLFDGKPIIEFEKPTFHGERYNDGICIRTMMKHKHLVRAVQISQEKSEEKSNG